MYFLPSSFATTKLVPLPQKKSATTSPLFELASIIILISFFGFCVSYPILSFEFDAKVLTFLITSSIFLPNSLR